jgi:hypothetical protein
LVAGTELMRKSAASTPATGSLKATSICRSTDTTAFGAGLTVTTVGGTRSGSTAWSGEKEQANPVNTRHVSLFMDASSIAEFDSHVESRLQGSHWALENSAPNEPPHPSPRLRGRSRFYDPPNTRRFGAKAWPH